MMPSEVRKKRRLSLRLTGFYSTFSFVSLHCTQHLDAKYTQQRKKYTYYFLLKINYLLHPRYFFKKFFLNNLILIMLSHFEESWSSDYCQRTLSIRRSLSIRYVILATLTPVKYFLFIFLTNNTNRKMRS